MPRLDVQRYGYGIEGRILPQNLVAAILKVDVHGQKLGHADRPRWKQLRVGLGPPDILHLTSGLAGRASTARLRTDKAGQVLHVHLAGVKCAGEQGPRAPYIHFQCPIDVAAADFSLDAAECDPFIREGELPAYCVGWCFRYWDARERIQQFHIRS